MQNPDSESRLIGFSILASFYSVDNTYKIPRDLNRMFHRVGHLVPFIFKDLHNHSEKSYFCEFSIARGPGEKYSFLLINKLV